MKNEKQQTKEWKHLVIPKHILAIKRMKQSAKLLLAYLAFTQGKNPRSYWPQDKMAEDLGTSRDTVKRDIKFLKDGGYINVKLERSGKSFHNSYAVLNKSHSSKLLQSEPNLTDEKPQFDGRETPVSLGAGAQEKNLKSTLKEQDKDTQSFLDVKDRHHIKGKKNGPGSSPAPKSNANVKKEDIKGTAADPVQAEKRLKTEFVLFARDHCGFYNNCEKLQYKACYACTEVNLREIKARHDAVHEHGFCCGVPDKISFGQPDPEMEFDEYSEEYKKRKIRQWMYHGCEICEAFDQWSPKQMDVCPKIDREAVWARILEACKPRERAFTTRPLNAGIRVINKDGSETLLEDLLKDEGKVHA